ncbi:hypothetical protein [Fusibacter sp. 3D3]|uniref:hypothetical protein n=1 Tax=Fusibacter sp. 3D3 TaxID=1048380 RepID=UPI001586F1E0|nr:hypothetical protein [Fusibacter sp. 3D3]
MTYYDFFRGEITYEEFHSFFRRKDMLLIQFVCLLSFLLIMGYINDMPLYVAIGASIVLAYGILLQTKAKTIKEQFMYSALWAISSFIIIVLILIIAVEVFGFMN